jgi:hypothetical protein
MRCTEALPERMGGVPLFTQAKKRCPGAVSFAFRDGATLPLTTVASLDAARDARATSRRCMLLASDSPAGSLQTTARRVSLV